MYFLLFPPPVITKLLVWLRKALPKLKGPGMSLKNKPLIILFKDKKKKKTFFSWPTSNPSGLCC